MIEELQLQFILGDGLPDLYLPVAYQFYIICILLLHPLVQFHDSDVPNNNIMRRKKSYVP